MQCGVQCTAGAVQFGAFLDGERACEGSTNATQSVDLGVFGRGM